MSKFIMMVGLPGSGKSTVADKYYPNAVWVSSDAIREELWGDASDQRNPEVIFEEMERRTLEALNDYNDVVYDATNLHSRTRKKLVTSIKRQVPGVECICELVITTISECKRRQFNRARKVPDEVIDRMARSFQVPYSGEGWDDIIINRNGPLQNLAKEHARLHETAHDNPHHTSGSVGAHCVEALKAVQNILREEGKDPNSFGGEILRTAAYHHDLGKHKTKTFYNVKGEPSPIAHFYGHENVGAYLWLSGDETEDDDWSATEVLLIAQLIQLHMMPYFFPNKSREEWAAWCQRRGYSFDIESMVWTLHEADLAAH